MSWVFVFCYVSVILFFSSRRRHTRCALVTGVQTCALPICSRGREKVLSSSLQMRLICDDFKFSSWNRTAAGKRTLARKAADAIRISPAGSPVASSRAMEAPLNPAVLESPQERHTDWASVVALITCIGVFGLALGLTYPLLSIMMVDAGFSDFFIGINGSATCVGVLLALFVLPGLLRAWGAFAVVVLGLAGSAA